QVLAEIAGPTEQDAANVEAIRRAVIQAKWDLSDIDETEIRIEPSPAARAGYRRPITRAEFEDIIRPLVERTLEPCRQALPPRRAPAPGIARGGSRARAPTTPTP